MCGIVGVVNNKREADNYELLEKMSDAIIHRGPDDSGFWACDGFGFGMRRLSIIDLKNGQQPIWSGEHTGIVFNGEIYNYKELRSDLLQKNVSFQTDSDTEVLLKLFEVYGPEGIQKTNGMFAACIVDHQKKKLHIFRDRMGIKPLYYLDGKDGFYFASELKSIAKVATLDLNFNAIDDYLALRYVTPSQSIWQNVKKLEPGQHLELDLESKDIQLKKFWDFSIISRPHSDSSDIEKFTELFDAAVQRRILSADVPVGVMLSGGLDSSAIAASAVKQGHKDFHTFCVGFEGADKENEFEYANLVAEHLGTKHHNIQITRDEFLNDLDLMVYHQDEPMADLSSIPLYRLCKEAKKHVKVILSGEGADELLGGYDFNQLLEVSKKYEKFDRFPYKNLLNVVGALLPDGVAQQSKYVARYGFKNLFAMKPSHISSLWGPDERAALWEQSRCSTGYVEPKMRDLIASGRSSDPIDALMESYCKSWLIEDLLMKADKMSMAASLELRVPFLDHTFVEFSSKLSHSQKFGFPEASTTKHILRKYLENIVPKRILTRPKRGFSIPVYRWLEESQFNASILDDLTNSDSKLGGLFDKKVISLELQNALKGSLEAQHKIWSLIILNKWMKRWAKESYL
ncbi:asparagine synthase (glutamine-hydrolyzing) [Curvivirga sp.]|uniref:asparagine synthase (glutamine-hydrolyzing) n=1 Tax=Curvivirga sp. TaxID=2856848 RepID=UPI003B5921E1